MLIQKQIFLNYFQRYLHYIYVNDRFCSTYLDEIVHLVCFMELYKGCQISTNRLDKTSCLLQVSKSAEKN